MTYVVFYEKPGCATNARQKKALRDAGHDLEVRDILSEPWSADELLGFFGADPVETWFNPVAPAVKSGEVSPPGMTADRAIALMIADPLLIRRPLIEAEGQKCAGFSREPVLSLLGPGKDEPDEDLESCRHLSTDRHCPGPKIQNPAEPDAGSRLLS